MSLIKCPECGNPVSTEASSCPKCGCPINLAEDAPPIAAGSFRAICPNCKAKYVVRDDKRGRTIACRKCKKPFLLESDNAEEAESVVPPSLPLEAKNAASSADKKKAATPKDNVATGCLGCLIMIGIAFGGFYLITHFPGCSSATGLFATGPSDMAAESAARSFIRQRMPNADFNWDSVVTNDDGSNYAVSGTLTAKNAFGGEIRYRYYCRLHYVSEDNWVSDSLTIEADL